MAERGSEDERLDADDDHDLEQIDRARTDREQEHQHEVRKIRPRNVRMSMWPASMFA